MEGVRVRNYYYQWSKQTGIPWNGRSYDRGNWKGADPVNRALSTANACLYGICHAAIASLGYSPGLGFIHTGKQLSFVYDVADLYKMDITVPAAFRSAATSTTNLERSARHHCRDLFKENRILERIVKDISSLFDMEDDPNQIANFMDEDAALPGALWDPSSNGGVQGGIQHQQPQQEGTS
jgi:CRISPR-associated protein Cas1